MNMKERRVIHRKTELSRRLLEKEKEIGDIHNKGSVLYIILL